MVGYIKELLTLSKRNAMNVKKDIYKEITVKEMLMYELISVHANYYLSLVGSILALVVLLGILIRV